MMVMTRWQARRLRIRQWLCWHDWEGVSYRAIRCRKCGKGAMG